MSNCEPIGEKNIILGSITEQVKFTSNTERIIDAAKETADNINPDGVTYDSVHEVSY